MRHQSARNDSDFTPPLESQGGVAAWLAGDDTALDGLRQPVEVHNGGCEDGGKSQRPEGPRGERSDPERSDPSGTQGVASLLETKPNTVTNSEVEGSSRLVVSSCGCRSWFCPRCCLSKGLKLRDEIKPVLATFTGTLMVTMTVDPVAFKDDPETAYRYVRDNRCISRLMRELRRRGLVHSDRWFGVVEWQKNGFAHYHIVLDAGFIDHTIVHGIWNSYGPADYQGRTLKNDYHVRLGLVSCNRRVSLTSEHAANYATKYLLKTPDRDFPDWVKRFDGRIRRYEKSRNFCVCDDESSQNTTTPEPADDEASATTKEKRNQQRNIGQIVANCGRDAALFEVVEIEIDGGEIVDDYRFLGRLKDCWEKLRDLGGFEDEPYVFRYNVMPERQTVVLNLFGVSWLSMSGETSESRDADECGQAYSMPAARGMKPQPPPAAA